MFSKSITVLALVVPVVIIRSLFVHKEFYLNIWENNKITIIFLGGMLCIFLLLIMYYRRLENSKKD